ncbi:hypothetical protein OG218_26160 [Kineococcus sp. NBC_00420]|uniref:WapI family immunity protein n=1 Tax=Kineococcus sp. NBC_00420 TaxID=2903564 RepID=UPI002E1E5395
MHLTSTDGALFELRPTGYQYPALNTPGDWDANWLNVHGQVRTAAGESWTFHDPSLTTWEAHELHRWLQAAAEGRIEPTDSPGEDGEHLLAFTEPNLAFSVASVVGEETLLRVHLSLEAVAGKPGWTAQSRPDLYEYSVPFRLDRRRLQTAAAQWSDDIASFPPR